jgi:hypothetical protein
VIATLGLRIRDGGEVDLRTEEASITSRVLAAGGTATEAESLALRVRARVAAGETRQRATREEFAAWSRERALRTPLPRREGK